MEIRKAIKEWSGAESKASGITGKYQRYLMIAVMALAFGAGSFGWFILIGGSIWKVVVGLILIFGSFPFYLAAKKAFMEALPEQPRDDLPVPDSLLQWLAREPSIGEEQKRSIAKLLSKRGRLRFIDLYRLDGKAQASAENGAGFREILEFSRPKQQ